MADYRYRRFRLVGTGATWDELAKSRSGESEGVLAVFRGEIGVPSDEGVVLEAGAGAASLTAGVSELSAEALTSTLRPRAPVAVTDAGVYAHRRFEVADADWAEFLDLSGAAWPDFETVNEGCHIVGLWRVAGAHTARDVAHALLITRYPSLAAWEKSRPYGSQPVDESKLDAWIAARDRFRRRGELTRRTVVCTYRLVG